MRKKKLWVIILVVSLIVASSILYAYNYKIVKGEYDQLTVTHMGEVTHVLNDQNKINEMINQINQSPRDFQFSNSGFKYDYLPHGILKLKNEQEEKGFRLVFHQGDQANIITDSWEIKTKFNFSE
ncbi:hypothetical protein [Aquisalibacillus elongatus]|uniref:Uncharacterized protein n=1 Tax=Aquisalibacillus elongatus TaxID=485577 RepID=A0A3N5AXV6_9BACI|nr:hypothetical protein [Aquisalibacillus elongatus]RPF50086.1 hypothetical protein EDC24_2903 [Aquisalibacillus elongatus]